MVNLALAVAVPLYIWPTPNAWQPLYNTIASSPNTTFNIIINPDSGPNGGSDPAITTAVTKLRSHKNVQLFGYVHISYTNRSAAAVKKDIATYASWKKSGNVDVHLDGIFLDEAPWEPSTLGYMRDLQRYIKQTMPAAHGQVWTNPGIPIDKRFYEYADYVNAYENTHEDWVCGGRDSIPECLRHRSTVMIHDFEGGDAELEAETKDIVAAGYNGSFVTTSSGYEEFSADWAQYVKDVAALVKMTKVQTLPHC